MVDFLASFKWLAPALFVGLCGFIAMFQAALALGAPWGHLAMGGTFPGRYPARMRYIAIVMAVLYLLLAKGAWDLSAGRSWLPVSALFQWLVLAAFFALGAAMNAISRSRAERFLWTPVSAVMMISAVIMAL